MSITPIDYTSAINVVEQQIAELDSGSEDSIFGNSKAAYRQLLENDLTALEAEQAAETVTTPTPTPTSTSPTPTSHLLLLLLLLLVLLKKKLI